MKARPNGYNEIKTLMVDKLFKLLASHSLDIKEEAAK